MDQPEPHRAVDKREHFRIAANVMRGVAVALLIVVVQAVVFAITLSVTSALVDVPIDSIRDSAPSSSLQIYSLLACEVVFAAAIIGCARGIAPARHRRSSTRMSIVRGVLLLSPVLIVFTVLPLIGLIAAGDAVVSDQLATRLIPALVALALAVGIAEEVAYRYLLVEVLGGARAPLLSTTLSAALFGLSHVSSGESYVLANAAAAGLAVGIPFAAVRIAGAPLAALVCAHAAIDTFALLRLGGLDLSRSPGAGELHTMIVMAALIALGYLLWLRSVTRQSRLEST